MASTRPRVRTRVLALVLASASFVQQALSAPAEIFESAAPVIGSDPPKARDVQDGDASVSTQTGALQYSYPIQVPPGRNGMAPSLNLAYSSQAPIYGTIAAGWSLSIPEIREDTSQGRLATHSPYYEWQQANQQLDPKDDDRFTSSLAGGRPLVKVLDKLNTDDAYGAYRAQNDASFARYERMKPGQPAKWRVRLLDGSTMYFGEAARTVGCTSVSEGYAPLTSHVDVFGNSILYEWEPGSPNECRIKQITWGYNATISSQPFAKVAFVWNPGVPRCANTEGAYIGSQFDLRTGRKILTGASELQEIVATAFEYGGQATPTHTRRIDLEYSPSTLSCTAGHSAFRQLASIQESAWFGQGQAQVNLPAISFEYGNPVVSLATQAQGSTSTAWSDAGATLGPNPNNLGWGTRAPDSAPDRWPTVEAMMLDIDGDGLLDRVFNSSSGGTCQATWQRNLGPDPNNPQSTRPLFGGGGTVTLPKLRWSNGSAPTAGLFEGCALNGQVTAYKNIQGLSTIKCHDGLSQPATGASCQLSSNPKLAGQLFCYSNNCSARQQCAVS